MNTFRLSAVSAALVVAAAIPCATQAVVPAVDSVGRPAQIKCGTTAGAAAVYAAHADKVIFRLSGGLPAVDPDDQPALDNIPRNTTLDIKVLDNPKTVADLKGKVLTFIGAVDNVNTRQNVTIIDVAYAMVCPTTAGAVAGAQDGL